jgi:hypothetical protein
MNLMKVTDSSLPPVTHIRIISLRDFYTSFHLKIEIKDGFGKNA